MLVRRIAPFDVAEPAVLTPYSSVPKPPMPARKSGGRQNAGSSVQSSSVPLAEAKKVVGNMLSQRAAPVVTEEKIVSGVQIPAVFVKQKSLIFFRARNLYRKKRSQEFNSN